MGRVVKGFGHVVARPVLDARAEADALLAATRAEAEARLAAAGAEAEARLAAARAEAEALEAGAAAAVEEARRAAREQGLAEGLAEAAATLAAARDEAARLLGPAAPDAVTLAVKMAEKIVGRAVSLAPEVMADIAGAALEACRPRGGLVRLRLHPDDLPAAEARRAALAARAPAASAIELVADGGVGRFGCVIETPAGRVDARLEAQLGALERALAGGPRA
jgi:flagellar biosynthesis/type III secretory pathway protein FliH